VFPVYKPIQLGSRIVSRPVPREPKFSSKFTYPGKSVVKATEVLNNTSNSPVSFVEDETTTPGYENEATTLSSHAVLDSGVKNRDDEEESPIFDVLPATYVGYSYVLDKPTAPNS